MIGGAIHDSGRTRCGLSLGFGLTQKRQTVNYWPLMPIRLNGWSRETNRWKTLVLVTRKYDENKGPRLGAQNYWL